MPLQQRLIEPVHVCRNTLPFDENGTLSVDVPNELECVTNGTLANIIRQLSSLSKQAEDIFGSLVRESTSIAARTNSLQGRVDRLAIKVTQLDSNVEEVSLQDIHMRKAFKSSVVYDQQVVSRDSIPAALKEIYLTCDKPPPLDKLNPYREDGKDGLKFYTDANYFFDLWKQEMLKDTERLAHDKGRKLAHIKEGAEPNQPRQERKRHKKVRQPHNTREKYRMMATKDEFLDKTANYSHLPYGMNHRPNSHMGDAVDNHSANGYPVRPSSLELQSAYGSGQESGYLSSPGHHYPPPPPAYIEHPQSPTHGYPPPPYTVATPDQQGGGSSLGTPTRQLSRVATMVRPTQPPPAPPISSNSSSGTSTPTVSATGTPSSGAGRYYKGSNHSRDNLPPPPPPPEGTVVNGGVGQYHILNNDMTQKSNRGPNGSIPHTPTHAIQQGGSRHGTPTHHPHVVTNHSTSILIQHNREQTPPPVNVIVNNQTHPTPESLDLPPPPPTPDKDTAPSRPESQLPPSPPPPTPPATTAPENGVLPPPPPPMPQPSQLPNGPIIANGGPSATEGRVNELASLSSESASTSSSLSKGSENQDSKGKGGTTDARSDLLAAIREGIKLRRVEDIKQKEVEKAAPLHDVASILARRIAMEFSDSDSASFSEGDSDAWDDETEC